MDLSAADADTWLADAQRWQPDGWNTKRLSDNIPFWLCPRWSYVLISRDIKWCGIEWGREVSLLVRLFKSLPSHHLSSEVKLSVLCYNLTSIKWKPTLYLKLWNPFQYSRNRKKILYNLLNNSLHLKYWEKNNQWNLPFNM